MMKLSSKAVERAQVIWDELADFPAARTDAALTHLNQSLADYIKADDAGWIGVVRVEHGAAARKDAHNGWRARISVGLRKYKPSEMKRLQELMQKHDVEPCMACCATAQLAGKFRVHRMRDGFVDFSVMRRTKHFQVLQEITGLEDRMWVGFPVNADAESFFYFDRLNTRKRFLKADADFVAYVLRGLKWFHRDLMRSQGLLVANQPMTTIQRKILHLLLTDKSEKEIADEVSQSPTTTHKYITEILRKFNVRGRAGLTALWLGH